MRRAPQADTGSEQPGNRGALLLRQTIHRTLIEAAWNGAWREAQLQPMYDDLVAEYTQGQATTTQSRAPVPSEVEEVQARPALRAPTLERDEQAEEPRVLPSGTATEEARGG